MNESTRDVRIATLWLLLSASAASNLANGTRLASHGESAGIVFLTVGALLLFGVLGLVLGHLRR